MTDMPIPIHCRPEKRAWVPENGFPLGLYYPGMSVESPDEPEEPYYLQGLTFGEASRARL